MTRIRQGGAKTEPGTRKRKVKYIQRNSLVMFIDMNEETANEKETSEP